MSNEVQKPSYFDGSVSVENLKGIENTTVVVVKPEVPADKLIKFPYYPY